MTTPNHRVLVVEDNVPTREELTEALRSRGFDVVSCGDKQTALRLVDEQVFCMALVDLQILGAPASIRPLETHGHALIQELRKKYPERHGRMDWRFPILVVSGYIIERAEAKDVIREGASDIVWKLDGGRLAAALSSEIQEQLRASGREDHADCCLTPMELSIPADREGQKTSVMLGARSAFLADRHLRVLLHLVKGTLKGKSEGKPIGWVHNLEMGFDGGGGNRLPSEVNNAMLATLPPGIEKIINNDHRGSYSLIETVTIGEIAYERLIAIEDSAITSLANEIRELKRKPSGQS